MASTNSPTLLEIPAEVRLKILGYICDDFPPKANGYDHLNKPLPSKDLLEPVAKFTMKHVRLFLLFQRKRISVYLIGENPK
jgi:hypothetical protein